MDESPKAVHTAAENSERKAFAEAHRGHDEAGAPEPCVEHTEDHGTKEQKVLGVVGSKV